MKQPQRPHAPSSEGSGGFTTSMAMGSLAPGRSRTVPTAQVYPRSQTTSLSLLGALGSCDVTGAALGLKCTQGSERENICFKYFFYSLAIKYFPSSFPRTSFISPRLPLATVSERNNEFLIGGGGGKRETLRQKDKTLIY